MKKIRTIDFTEGNATQNLILLFVPLMIAFFFSMAFDINDSIWIGNLIGEKALAAQTVSMPLIMIYNAACMGVTGGIGILMAQAIGARKSKEIDEITATSFWALLLLSFVVMLICEMGMDGVLSAVGTPKEIYTIAKNFLMIHVISFPFVMMYMYLSALLRSYGNSSMQLLAIIGCTLLNVVLDPIFIRFMGLDGVALATVISEAVMMIAIFVYCKKNRLIKISIKLFNFKILNDILEKAIPSMIQQSIPSISMAFITSIVSIFGVIPIAAYGTATKIETLLLYPPMAMNMAISSATGQCFGANKHFKVREYLKSGIITGEGILLILSFIVSQFSQYFAHFFGVSDKTGALVETYFMIVAVGYIFNMLTNCALGMVNGAGKPKIAMLLMVFYYILIRMPLAKILSMTRLGINGIWIAVLVSHIVAAFASWLLGLKMLKNQMDN